MIELKFDPFEGEIWKEVEGYEDLYIISNKGRLASRSQKAKAKNQKFFDNLLIYSPLPTGYLQVKLWKDAKGKSIGLHRIVAKTFIPNPDNKPEVNHLDGNKLNNEVSNLEWVTAKENNTHALKLGLKTNGGGNQKSSKVVLQIANDGTIIHEYNSLREAERLTGIDRPSIGKTCRGKQNGAGGYFWCYKENYNPNNIKIRINSERGGKTVCKINEELTDLVKEYKSISEAEKQEGMKRGTLSKRIKNKTIYKGHIYKLLYL